MELEKDGYAIIGRVKIIEIPEANTLNTAIFNGLPYAVDKTVNEEDLYVIFLPDGQLSEEYAVANDCIERRDEEGNKAGGFFAKNRKVRAVKFMKGAIKSVGYIAKLESLAFTGYDLCLLKEGEFVDTLNDIPIANKFIIPVKTSGVNNNNQKKSIKKVYIGMAEHANTNHYWNNTGRIDEACYITITEKLDGTSVRLGNALEIKPLKWYEKIINWFIPVDRLKESLIAGSRRVIMDKKVKRDTGWYEDDNLYKSKLTGLEKALFPGETIYGEIVGYQSSGKILFSRGGVNFTYSCQPGESKLFVYNITWTLLNSQSISLPWWYIKERCKYLGFETVPELHKTIPVLNTDYINTLVTQYTDGQSTLDKHLREGCVVRVDRGTETFFLKSKSADFLILEDKSKNDGEIDIEEMQEQEI